MDFLKLLHAMAKALPLVEEAATKFLDNQQRREWVVQQLVHDLHLPESLARAAVELAVLVTKHAPLEPRAPAAGA